MNEYLAAQAAYDALTVMGMFGFILVALVVALLVGSQWISPHLRPAEPATHFFAGQRVKVIRSMEWIYGPSCTVPVGAIVTLMHSFDTIDGPRWTGTWKHTYLHSVPEDCIAPYSEATDAAA